MPRHAAPRTDTAPRWARVGAVIAIAWAAGIGSAAVVVVAHDVAVDDGLIAATAPAAVPCGTDAQCAWLDWDRGISPAPDVAAGSPDAMCPAGWQIVGIDDDTVPAACVPALLPTV
jgi:hypothetical protein